MLNRLLSKSFSEYGMVVVLLLLCCYYSWATLEQRPTVGAAGGKDCAAELLARGHFSRVAIAAGPSPEDDQFVAEATRRLHDGGVTTVTAIGGEPRAARQSIARLGEAGAAPQAFVVTSACAAWLPRVIETMPAVTGAVVAQPQSRLWPTFLLADNLLNVANQIVVIAVIAVGMTMVIITGGIDLSVGSLVALSAVVAGVFIHRYAGGAASATPAGLIAASVGAIVVSGLVGAFSGAMITAFRVPPFIATLAMMQVASGLAYICAGGESIYDIPASFTWLGRGVGPMGVPNAVWLMLAVFAIASIVMSRTRLGRYIYAVGGNAEAARLSGISVGGILMTVYTVSGVCAGLGGVIVASQLKSSSPTYGLGYELYVIAAVVVGGTSLAGGEGKILGTLVGALIIAVIQNGMNLTGVESYRQKVVLGFVILGAVLLDRLKKRTWRLPYWLRAAPPTPQGVAALDQSPQTLFETAGPVS